MLSRLQARLQEFVQAGETNVNTLQITLGNDFSDLIELISFFQSHKLTVTKLIIKFDANLPPARRSTVLLMFLPGLQYLSGLKSFELESTVRDYALNDLLKDASILKLEALKIVHASDRSDESQYNIDEPVNSNAVFEESLVTYLRNNPALIKLEIEDIKGRITANNNPQLRAAMCNHSKLTVFKQGFFNAMNASALENDPELMFSLVQHVVEDPAVKKAQLEAALEKVKDAVLNLTRTLETIVVLRKQIHKNEDTWMSAVNYLESIIHEVKRLKSEYAKLHNDDENIAEKRSLLNLIHNYVVLLDNVAALLQSKLVNSPALRDHKDDLEKFWDITRNNIQEKVNGVINGTNHDVAQVKTEIVAENRKLLKIYRAANSVVYPASYKNITTVSNNDLEKARILLADYTKNNSAVSRFFHGHWNRHHVAAVHSIVMCINEGELTTVEAVLRALNKINLTNSNGSLAKRISFIKQNCQSSDDLEDEARQANRV